MLQKLKARTRQMGKMPSRSEILMLAIAIPALLWIAFVALQVGHWRHDEVAYLEKGALIFRTQAEGRWLNLLLYSPTKLFSPEFGWILNTLLLGGGFVLMGWRIGLGWACAVAMAVTVLLFPGYTAQSLWPTSTLPAVVIWFGTVVLLMEDRLRWIGISRLWVLPLAGIALFATIPHFYFLLLPVLLPLQKIRSWADFSRSLVPGVVWSVGLLLGYGVALLVNGLRYGHFSLLLEHWRKDAMPDIEGGLAGAAAFHASLPFQHILDWLPLVCALAWLAVIMWAIHDWFRRGGNSLTLLVRLGYIAVLIAMPYIVGAAGGIVVQFRSLIPLALGLTFLPVFFASGRGLKAVSMAAVLLIGIPSTVKTMKDLNWYAAVAQDNIVSVRSAIPAGMRTDRRAALLDDGYEDYFNVRRKALHLVRAKPVFLEGMGHEDFRIGPAFLENGFDKFEACSSDQIDCHALRVGEETLPYCDGAKVGTICAQSVLSDGSVLFRFKMSAD